MTSWNTLLCYDMAQSTALYTGPKKLYGEDT